MPDQAPIPGQTPAPPPAGAGGSPQPGQPAAGGSPFGNSGATQPTPNRGYEAQALQGLGLVVMKLDEIVKMIGVTGELGAAVSETIKKLSKFVPPGSMTPSSQTNQINQLGVMEPGGTNLDSFLMVSET